MIRARAVLSLIALVGVCRLLPAQAAPSAGRVPSYRARILGVFDESGAAIEGAEVIDVLSRTSALTTKTGTVSLAFLPDSGSLVRIQKIGYQPVTRLVAISPADTVPITIVLSAIATTLPTVVTRDSAPHHISPGLQAFEERRRMGFGKFVTEPELRKSDNRTLTNVIREQGVKVNCRVFPRACFAASSRSCGAFEVYRDGMLLDRQNRDLEAMRVDEFSGIEIYAGPATIPPLYNKTGSACGVLLLWSRER